MTEWQILYLVAAFVAGCVIGALIENALRPKKVSSVISPETRIRHILEEKAREKRPQAPPPPPPPRVRYPCPILSAEDVRKVLDEINDRCKASGEPVPSEPSLADIAKQQADAVVELKIETELATELDRALREIQEAAAEGRTRTTFCQTTDEDCIGPWMMRLSRPDRALRDRIIESLRDQGFKVDDDDCGFLAAASIDISW